MVWVAKAQLATLTDSLMRAYVVTASATRAALDARFVQPADVGTQVAAAVAASSTVTSAAQNAVSGAMAAQNLSWSLVQGGPQLAALTTLRGTASYAGAGKFGQAETGAVLSFTGMAGAQEGDYTAEFWYKQATQPAGTPILLFTPFGYLGVTGTNSGNPGKLYWQDPAALFGANVNDGVLHHIAFVVSILPGTTRKMQAVYVDGVKTNSGPVTTSSSSWDGQTVVGGFAAEGFDFLAATFDEVRLSFAAANFTTEAGTKARYTANFTPPSARFEWDDSTLILAHMESSAITVKAAIYPPRPVGAPGGAVTYVGTSSPSGMLPRDRWIQA